MSLSKLDGVVSTSDSFFTRTLNTPMNRREFLTMGGALVLSLLGVQSLFQIITKHTGGVSTNLMAQQQNGFGSRKFGQ